MRKFIIFTLTLLVLSLCLFSCDVGVDIPEPHVHTFGEWRTVREATCTLEGISERICAECGDTEEKSVERLAHTLKASSTTAPDCTNEGYTTYVCECGYSEKKDPVKPLGHSLTSSAVVPPACEDEGYTNYVCECGYSEKKDPVKPLGHSLTSSVIAPTCEDEGYTKHSCQNCDYVYKSDKVAPTGHDTVAVVTRPTVLSAGFTTHTCHCSYTYTDNHVLYSDILASAYVENKEILAKGIDVSRWNHPTDPDNGEYLPLDWEAIKASGVDFVILKAGSTNSGIEPTFEMDYAGARAAGLEIGVYFYTYSSTVEDIAKDAATLMEWLDGKMFEYPIYLDLEDSSLEALGKDILSDMCAAFISALQSNGYYAGLYSNHNWLTNILDTQKMLSLYDVWYARYPGTSSPSWNEEKYGKQLGMWQYSDSGTIDGFDRPFDLNYSYKNFKDIMVEWKLNGF